MGRNQISRPDAKGNLSDLPGGPDPGGVDSAFVAFNEGVKDKQESI